jgi:tetrathionate reductase subunit A
MSLLMVANVAADGTPVPDTDQREEEVFRRARRHLAAHTFDEDRWREAAGADWWKKVVYVLNRGGRFQDDPDTYRGEQLTNAYPSPIPLAPASSSTTPVCGSKKFSILTLPYSPMTVAATVRRRGRTSHSSRNTCCQVPSTRLRSRTGTVSAGPSKVACRCE